MNKSKKISSAESYPSSFLQSVQECLTRFNVYMETLLYTHVIVCYTEVPSLKAFGSCLACVTTTESKFCLLALIHSNRHLPAQY